MHIPSILLSAVPLSWGDWTCPACHICRDWLCCVWQNINNTQHSLVLLRASSGHNSSQTQKTKAHHPQQEHAVAPCFLPCAMCTQETRCGAWASPVCTAAAHRAGCALGDKGILERRTLLAGVTDRDAPVGFRTRTWFLSLLA